MPELRIFNNAVGNPRVPFLEFWIGEGDSAFRVTLDPDNRKRDDPPYVEAFEYRKRTRNFSAGEWSVTLVDPNFDLLDKIMAVFNYSALDTAASAGAGASLDYAADAPLGTVKFSFGYTLSSGETIQSPWIQGYVLKLKPSFFRWGVRLVLSGLDFNLVSQASVLRVEDIISWVVGHESSTIADFIEAMLGQTRAGTVHPVSFLFQPASLGTVGVSSLLQFFGVVSNGSEEGGAVVTTANYEELATYTSDGSNIAVKDFMRLIQDFYLDTMSKTVYIRLDGLQASEEPGVTSALQYTAVEAGVEMQSLNSIPMFQITSQRMAGPPPDNAQMDNFSNVSSFDLNIDPIAIGILALCDTAEYARDPLTRETELVEAPMSEYAGPVEGDGLSVVPSLVSGEESTSDVDPVTTNPGVGASVVLAGALSSLGGTLKAGVGGVTPAAIKRARVRRQMVYAAWPFQGSLTVEYPDPNLNPWEPVLIYVLTAAGGIEQMTSGRYIVKDIQYRINPGKFQGVYSVLKSGSSGVPKMTPDGSAVHPDVPAPEGTPQVTPPVTGMTPMGPLL